MSLNATCHICAGSTEHALTLFDDRYGFPGLFEMRKCRDCCHRSLSLTMSSEELGSLYTDYYPRSGFDVETWRAPADIGELGLWLFGERSSAFRWVPDGVRVLDIGCGFGESLGYHRNHGSIATGVEADSNILRVAERHDFDVKVGLFDPGDHPPASFDYVTLDQVLEHMSEPIPVLQGVMQVLKPGGRAIITMPNIEGWGRRVFGKRWIHWHIPYHQQFFTQASMKRAASAAGLLIERHKTVTNPAWLNFQLCHLPAYPKPGHRSAFWSTGEPRSVIIKLQFRIAKLIELSGFNMLVTRLFDAIGLGDNIVYVLRKPA